MTSTKNVEDDPPAGVPTEVDTAAQRVSSPAATGAAGTTSSSMSAPTGWRNSSLGAMAFSILITNVDDHLLNHGFLHAGYGQWRLFAAPIE